MALAARRKGSRHTCLAQSTLKQQSRRISYSMCLLFNSLSARGWACIGQLLALWLPRHKAAHLGNLVGFVQQLRRLGHCLWSWQSWRSQLHPVKRRTISFAHRCTRSPLWSRAWHCWRSVLIGDLHLAMRSQSLVKQRYGLLTGSRNVIRRSQDQNRSSGLAERVCKALWILCS